MSWKRENCYLREVGFSCSNDREGLTCGKSGLDSVKYCVVWEESMVREEEVYWLVLLGIAKESFLFVRLLFYYDWQCHFLKIPWKNENISGEMQLKALVCLGGAVCILWNLSTSHR